MPENEPNPRQILAVLLGASSFDRAPKLAQGRAFYNSAQGFREYLTAHNGLRLSRENVSWFFDDTSSPNDQLRNIGSFLESRSNDLRNKGTPPQDLIVYYVGHGLFSGRDQAYCLAVRATDERSEGLTSIRVSDLADMIKEYARLLRKFLILDCCFSAAAYKEFQSGPLQVAHSKLLDNLPQRGTALLCSASAQDASLAPEGLPCTMFSSALIEALSQGDRAFGPSLSVSELGGMVKANLRETYPDSWVRPEVHSPDQREGDIASVGLFPNPAYAAQKVEEERREAEAEKAQQEAEAHARIEAERKAREEAEAKAAAERAAQEKKERERQKAEAKKAQQEAEAHARIEAERKTREEARAKAAAERAAQEKRERERQKAEAKKAQQEAEARARMESERRTREEAEAKAAAERAAHEKGKLELLARMQAEEEERRKGRQLHKRVAEALREAPRMWVVAAGIGLIASVAAVWYLVPEGPDNAGAHVLHADELFDRGETETAIAEYRRATGLKPDDAEAHYKLGFALEQKGDLTNAVQEYGDACKLNPKQSLYCDGYLTLSQKLSGTTVTTPSGEQKPTEPAHLKPRHSGPIRVAGGVQAGLILNRIDPTYPPLARQTRISGTVRLHAIIGEDGSVEEVEVVSGHPLLQQAALDAVRQWRYRPTHLNGEPVKVVTTIDVIFSLNQ